MSGEKSSKKISPVYPNNIEMFQSEQRMTENPYGQGTFDTDWLRVLFTLKTPLVNAFCHQLIELISLNSI